MATLQQDLLQRLGLECLVSDKLLQKSTMHQASEFIFLISGLEHWTCNACDVVCLRVTQLPRKDDAGNVTLLVCPHFVQARAVRPSFFESYVQPSLSTFNILQPCCFGVKGSGR